MATEQEYDEIIAPMMAAVAEKCSELGMNIIARVEWEPGESGITQIGDLKSSAGQMLTQVAAHAHGNIDGLILHLIKNHDVSASIFLHKHAPDRKAGVSMTAKEPYEAGYNDARADALYELRLALRDISEGDTVKNRLQQLEDDIRNKELPEERS